MTLKRTHITLLTIGILVLVVLFAFPSHVFAGEGFFGPIVPSCDPVAGCGKAELIQLASNLFNFLISLAMFITVIFTLWGGFIFLTSGGSTDRIERGKKTITAAIVGLIIVLVAWVTINILMDFFTNCTGSWYIFESLTCG